MASHWLKWSVTQACHDWLIGFSRAQWMSNGASSTGFQAAASAVNQRGPPFGEGGRHQSGTGGVAHGQWLSDQCAQECVIAMDGFFSFPPSARRRLYIGHIHSATMTDNRLEREGEMGKVSWRDGVGIPGVGGAGGLTNNVVICLWSVERSVLMIDFCLLACLPLPLTENCGGWERCLCDLDAPVIFFLVYEISSVPGGWVAGRLILFDHAQQKNVIHHI